MYSKPILNDKDVADITTRLLCLDYTATIPFWYKDNDSQDSNSVKPCNVIMKEKGVRIKIEEEREELEELS